MNKPTDIDILKIQIKDHNRLVYDSSLIRVLNSLTEIVSSQDVEIVLLKSQLEYHRLREQH